jgi:hypothetical protein
MPGGPVNARKSVSGRSGGPEPERLTDVFDKTPFSAEIHSVSAQ